MTVEPCPFPDCDATSDPRGLEGHIRLSHAGDPRTERVLELREVQREARRAEGALAYLVGQDVADTELNESTVNACERVEAAAREELAQLVEHQPSRGS